MAARGIVLGLVLAAAQARAELYLGRASARAGSTFEVRLVRSFAF